TRLGLAFQLAVLLCVCGALLWWIVGSTMPAADGLPASITAAIRMVCAILVCMLALLGVLVLTHRHYNRPLHKLVNYVAQQNSGANRPPPASLLKRNDNIGWLAGEIGALLNKLTEQNRQLLEETLYDPLTDLGNRRLLERRLQVALPLSR